VFAYKSAHPPLPLAELERLLVVSACGGNTNWHHLIYRAQRYDKFYEPGSYLRTHAEHLDKWHGD